MVRVESAFAAFERNSSKVNPYSLKKWQGFSKMGKSWL